MEMPSCVRNGELRLPIGFRFHPTDEELLVHYLKRKALSLPLPASVIPEFDVFQTDPWALPGDLKERRYFFSRREKGNNNGKRWKRATGSGYWKVVGKEKQILGSGSNKQALGMKRNLAFYERKQHPHVSRTCWIMHEYCLVGSGINPNNSTQKSMVEMEDWVVYRVFQKKRKPRSVISKLSNSNKTGVISPSCIDFMIEKENFDSGILPPPQLSPSCSSGITDDVSSNGSSDQEEISGYINAFSSFSYCMKDH